jgi:hypothetical protein
MKTSIHPDDLEIAPGYTVGCWKELKLNPDVPDSADWQKAVEIFDARIRRRFLEPVDELIKFDKCLPQRARGRPARPHDTTSGRHKTFGFAILAIDFLVIETLQGFREGETHHKGKSKRLFTNFLKQWDAFTKCLPVNGNRGNLANQVYDGYRCDLHHAGSTLGAFRVLAIGPTFEFKNNHEVIINRTCLHACLNSEFEAYLADLCVSNKGDLRRNFLRKMNAICGVLDAP